MDERSLFVSEKLPHFPRSQLFTALVSLKTDSAGAQVAINGAIYHFLFSRNQGHDWWSSSVDLRSDIAANGKDDESALRQALVDISRHKYLADQLFGQAPALGCLVPCGSCTEYAIPSKTAGSAPTESAPKLSGLFEDDDDDDVSVYSVSTQPTGKQPARLSSPGAVADDVKQESQEEEKDVGGNSGPAQLLMAGSGKVAQVRVPTAALLLPTSTRPHREKKAVEQLAWREREGVQTWTHVGRRKRMRERGVAAGSPPGTAQKTSKVARRQAEWLPSTDESEAIIRAKCQEWSKVLQKGIVQATALSQKERLCRGRSVGE